MQLGGAIQPPAKYPATLFVHGQWSLAANSYRSAHMQARQNVECCRGHA
eukprot:CAMPEP_0204584104 /NCGR_PEP_ID=MMETSP0661-20131031/46153_1 /ASSEMBLY_ACC=CAM_ASM_000606 /TAXON_ID=109239 /ORGANISM="Alexandrium margalefi, Strain AMGDE01CS-322" /LENGTH=48 /DNA_ID= /DNA_START= /DNA_END= /DNA_ORIENTATION=